MEEDELFRVNWVEELRDAREERAERMAEFCLKTGIAPSEYKKLTLAETRAFVKVANKLAKKK
jgi:hypothetical protein